MTHIECCPSIADKEMGGLQHLLISQALALLVLDHRKELDALRIGDQERGLAQFTQGSGTLIQRLERGRTEWDRSNSQILQCSRGLCRKPFQHAVQQRLNSLRDRAAKQCWITEQLEQDVVIIVSLLKLHPFIAQKR